jgi:hypothetical protein
VELDDGHGDTDDQVLHIWKKKKEKNKKKWAQGKH